MACPGSRPRRIGSAALCQQHYGRLAQRTGAADTAAAANACGQPVLRRTAEPSGLKRDGSSAVYQRLQVAAGEQKIAVRMKDDVRAPGFTAEREDTVTLKPSQVLVIDYNAEKGGIVFQ